MHSLTLMFLFRFDEMDKEVYNYEGEGKRCRVIEKFCQIKQKLKNWNVFRALSQYFVEPLSSAIAASLLVYGTTSFTHLDHFASSFLQNWYNSGNLNREGLWPEIFNYLA